jgi:hypothetical protein
MVMASAVFRKKAVYHAKLSLFIIVVLAVEAFLMFHMVCSTWDSGC